MKTTSEQTRPGRGARRMYRWLPPMGVAAAMASPAQPVQAEGPRPLSHERAEQLYGGVRVDILDPPANNWYQGADDMYFRAKLTNIGLTGAGQDAVAVSLWSENAFGAGKHRATVLSVRKTGDSKIWETRVPWPTYNPWGEPDLVYKWYWPDTEAYYVGSGDARRTDVYVHPNVKVAQVQLYSVKSGSQSTYADWNRYDKIINVKQLPTPGRGDNFIDGIYNQCGKSDRNGELKHWQVRLLPRVKAITVPPACQGGTCVPCTDMRKVYEAFCADVGGSALGAVGKCAPLTQCVDSMLNEADPIDRSANVAVFQLRSSPAGYGVSFVRGRDAGTFTGIVDAHMNGSVEGFARLFSHEMGHRILGRSDRWSAANKPKGGILDEACAGDPVGDLDHPLMCSRTPGRRLYVSECTYGYQSDATSWNY